MQIVDVLSGSVPIKENKINIISFENKEKMRELIKYFIKLESTKTSTETDLYIVDENLNKVTSKSTNFILFDDILLLSKYDKRIREIIIRYLKFKIEVDDSLFLEYQKSKRNIENFFNDIKIESNGYSLDFFLEDIDIDSIVKKLEIDISFNKDEESRLDIIRLIIDLSMKLEIEKKEFFICLLFPENSINFQEFYDLLDYLRKLNMTVLVITNEELFFRETQIEDEVILINRFFEKYDINALKHEYKLFYGDREQKKLLQLAFLDFRENYNLIDYLTPIENIRLVNKSADESILFELGLDKKQIKRNVMKLSGGQQQRVAIARALVSDAPIILADEPTGNLDSVTAGEIINILKTLAKDRNKCVIVVTHSKEVAASADIILELSGKKLKKVNKMNLEVE